MVFHLHVVCPASEMAFIKLFGCIYFHIIHMANPDGCRQFDVFKGNQAQVTSSWLTPLRQFWKLTLVTDMVVLFQLAFHMEYQHPMNFLVFWHLYGCENLVAEPHNITPQQFL